MKKIFLAITLAFMTLCPLFAQGHVYEMSRFGIKPGKNSSMTVKLQKALTKIAKEAGDEPVVLNFKKGVYHFYQEGTAVREYYISNHDQQDHKNVVFPLEGCEQVTLEGNGSEFIFHGVMIPFALVDTDHCTLRNFSIDYENPAMTQIEVIRSDENGVAFRPAPGTTYRINEKNQFVAYGEGWEFVPCDLIAYEGGAALAPEGVTVCPKPGSASSGIDPRSRRIIYRTSEIYLPGAGVKEIEPGLCLYEGWKQPRLRPGNVVAIRDYQRPTPGIFLYHADNTVIENVTVHYAFGMGLLAQMTENISLDHFNVCLRGADDQRFFTTNADATHFSGCKGLIRSTNGLYEGMMDDAINVHGTYLKLISQESPDTFVARYMHYQTYGFDWGFAGDTVQVVRSRTMDYLPEKYVISSIAPADQEEVKGAKTFRITFDRPLEDIDLSQESYGIENLTWTPEVYFAGNVIRNNRARGSLFSTPKKTVVENNLFDHVSGTGILLCGDCNGWYETGACRNVLIRHNKFVNNLTSLFQFTSAVISIYPEIPNLKGQTTFFHGGQPGAIVIEENEFDIFDAPVLYAKSVDGLIFRNNVIRTNQDYEPYHYNQNRFLFERVTNLQID